MHTISCAPFVRPLPAARLARSLLAAACLCAGAVPVFPAAAAAQLRPLATHDWSIFEHGRTASVQLGAAVFQQQRASLAGTEGRLIELGLVDVSWRTGRVALQLSGTVLRFFDDELVFAPPAGGAQAPSGDRRSDSGDYRISTLVLFTPPNGPTAFGLRFGTRLPTTDNRVGLERDQTDFYALLAGRYRRAGFSLQGEAGLGINGTRESSFEQSDVLLYAVELRYHYGPFTSTFSLLGQMDGLDHGSIRGNEELSEAQFGLTIGSRRWVRAAFVKGLTEFSPRSGLILAVGSSY